MSDEVRPNSPCLSLSPIQDGSAPTPS